MLRKGQEARRRFAGFTLLELLVAVALMAVLAVLGWRGLDSVLTGRERIAARSDALRDLSAAFTQLEDDLRRAWPARLLGPGMPVLAFVAEAEGAPPALHLLRELPPDGGPEQLQRVVWRLRDGVLERGFGAFVPPGAQGASTAAALTWQPLVARVSAVQMRGWIAGRGWQPAAALPGLEGPTDAASQVTGLELLLERRDSAPVLRVFAVRD